MYTMRGVWRVHRSDCVCAARSPSDPLLTLQERSPRTCYIALTSLRLLMSDPSIIFLVRLFLGAWWLRVYMLDTDRCRVLENVEKSCSKFESVRVFVLVCSGVTP